MKKILLPGMMAALAFAACTNEEIVSQKTTEAPEADLSNRPVVGMVGLNFGPQTRLALQDGTFGTPEYTPGEDMIGARLIDVVAGDECFGAHHAEHKYSISEEYAWTNYRYDLLEDGRWDSHALMVEGNYMFYTPYNEKALYRTPLEVVFPTTQKVTTLTAKNVPAQLNRNSYDSNTEAVENFYKDGGYTVAVGHTFVSAEDQKDGEVYVTPEMTQLYAYPQITLVNDYAIKKMVPKLDEAGEVVLNENGEPVMVEETNEDGTTKWYPQDLKIDEITILSSNIMLNGKINHAGLVDALKLDIEEVSHTDNRGNKVVDCPEEIFENWEDGQQTAWFQQYARTKTIVDFATTPYDASKGQKNPDGKITIELENSVTIKPGQMVTLNVVMPAATYAGDNFKVNVRVLTENEEGEVVRMMFEDHSYVGDGWEEGKSLSYAVAKRYAMEEYNYPVDGSAPSPKTSAGALATFHLNGTLVPYDEIEDVPEAPNYVGIEDNDEFLAWLDGITDNSTPKEEANVMDKDHSFKLHEEHNVTLDAALIDAVQKYMNDATATLDFNTYLYVQGSDDETNPLVIDGAKFIRFGKVILKGGYIKFLNAKIGEVAYAENSDAVVTYEGGSVGSVSKVTGDVKGTTLKGDKITFCEDITLTNVTIDGAADFDGGCGKHTITLDGVTVTGHVWLSGKNNIVKDATFQSSVDANGDVTVTEMETADVKLYHGKTITVEGENAMTWGLEMKAGGKLVVNNANWNPTTVSTGDGNATVEINADWAPKSVAFAGTGDKIVDVNAAVDFTNIKWTAKYNAQNKLVSSYTINNNGTISSDLDVPANAVYNQAVKNAAVTGELNNYGTINVNGAIEVEENTGLIVAGSKTDKISVTTGRGKIDNTKGAVVSAGDNQSVFYTIEKDFTNADINAAVGIIDGGINMIVAEGYWTSESDMTTGYKLPEAIKTIQLVGNGERMYLEGKLDFNKAVVYIDGKMSWRGRTVNSSAIVNLDAEYADGAELSTEDIDMTGAYADVLADGGTITLTDDLVLTSKMTVNSDVTINLNGRNIIAEVDGSGDNTTSYAFVVENGGKLTINGDANSKVTTADAYYSIAVWAKGGEVVINGGTFQNAGDGCELIYASAGGKVTINGGKYIATAKEGAEPGTANLYTALNLQGNSESSIVVNAGEFLNFNPANNLSEGTNTNFVAEGSTLTAVGTKDGAPYTFVDPYADVYDTRIATTYGDVTYTVTAPAAAN